MPNNTDESKPTEKLRQLIPNTRQIIQAFAISVFVLLTIPIGSRVLPPGKCALSVSVVNDLPFNYRFGMLIFMAFCLICALFVMLPLNCARIENGVFSIVNGLVNFMDFTVGMNLALICALLFDKFLKPLAPCGAPEEQPTHLIVGLSVLTILWAVSRWHDGAGSSHEIRETYTTKIETA